MSDSIGMSDGEEEALLAGENPSTTKPTSVADTSGNPTNTEIMSLNETTLLYKSNLFQLQIDELLKETQAKPSKKLSSHLQTIRNTLMALDPIPGMSADAANNYARKMGLAIPFPDPSPPVGMPIEFKFQPPTQISVVGSYPLGMSVKSLHGGYNVDMSVQMPSDLFGDRDYLNYRYCYKRAFYLAVLLAGLGQSKELAEEFTIDWDLLSGDLRMPIVALSPKSRKYTVRLLPCIAHDTMPLKRLTADRNHIRPGFLADTADDEKGPATPQYSSTVLRDALLLTHMNYLYETTEMCPAFKETSKLLRLWINQRVVSDCQVSRGWQRINGFLLSMLLADQVRSADRGSATMTCYQLFKHTIEWLATHDFHAVFTDPSGSLNLLAGVQEWELRELRMVARASALDINHRAEDRFAQIFLHSDLTHLSARYDHVMCLDIDMSQVLSAKHGTHLDIQKRLHDLESGHPVAAVQQRLAQFLAGALKSQAELVAVHPCKVTSFSDGSKVMRRHRFYIGIQVNEESLRLVNLGPNPDSQPAEAAQFRHNWGDRAELRRFRDGSIRLATVWGDSGMPMEQRAQIVPQMVGYLLHRHFSVQAESLFGLSDRLPQFAQTIDSIDHPHLTFEAAIRGFDQLQGEIKQLEDQLPLRVLSLHPISPGLRYSSLAPPKPVPVPEGDDSFIDPLHVVVEFTSSGKWPDDVVAIHKVKAAFLLRLSECYQAAHPDSQVQLVNRYLGLDGQDGLLTGLAADQMAYESDSCLDIRHHSSGLTFRLSILCDREGVLLERKAQDLRRGGLTLRAEALEQTHQQWLRNYRWRAQHHRRILDLCQRHHPSASLTIRLLKRWLSRHLLLGHWGVSEELAELAVARVFTDNTVVPGSAATGFIRCLRLLAGWRWNDSLCVVDFSRCENTEGVWVSKTGMSTDTYNGLQKAFESANSKQQIRIATEQDPMAQWWGTVSVLVTRRIRSLALESLRCLDSCLASASDAELPMAFTTPLDDYDFLIKLDRQVVCRRYEQPPQRVLGIAEEEGQKEQGEAAKTEVFKNLLPKAEQQHPLLQSQRHPNPFHQPGMVDFDPVSLYLWDLQRIYGHSLLLFSDCHGGSVVGGLWNPSVTVSDVPFAASTLANMRPAADGKKARYNREAVVEEVARLGEGLVADVVIQKQ